MQSTNNRTPELKMPMSAAYEAVQTELETVRSKLVLAERNLQGQRILSGVYWLLMIGLVFAYIFGM